MTTPTPAPVPAALPAFLRGVERRAAVFAELQCGDAQVGDAALAAAMRAFRGGIERLPLAQWPQRFWILLLAAPALRRPAPMAAWAPQWQWLASLGNGARATLLLRLAGMLDADTAAAALAVAPQRYRQALSAALPRRGDGGVDTAALQQLEDAVQLHIRQLPVPRLVQLAQLRERSLLSATASPPAARWPAAPPAQRPRWLRPVLWLGVVACALAFAATFVAPALTASGRLPAQLAARLRGDGIPRIRREALPPAEAAATRFEPVFAAVLHRDFELLADPDGLRQAQALPLMAGYAAELAARRDAGEAGVAPAATMADLVEATAAERPVAATAIATPPPPTGVVPPALPDAQLQRLPAAVRASVRPQVATWANWNAAQRGAYLARQRAWDGLSISQRAAQREHYLAWRALPPATQAEVELAAAAFARLPEAEQQARRAEFAALDRSTQRGWLLGPALGADYPRLQPLLAQLPEAEHAPLLAVLHALDSAGRADLAVLAQRVPPQERAALRRALLSTAAGNRAAWLRTRLEQ